jgi:ABC-2 type transport system ATP-binding protein
MSNMSERAVALDVDDLHASYGNVRALQGVTLGVFEGECFGILGPNGAGKTTLLSCIETLKRPHRGRIHIFGVDIRRDPARARSLIGAQLQDSALFGLFTTVELVQFYATLYRRSIDRRHAVQILERFALEEKAASQKDQLSGGQQQRLRLAIALVNDPRLLLLDEPTAALDPQARLHFWDLVEHLRAEGRTIILTTHQMEEAEHLCDRVGIIDHGRVLAIGTPRELIGGIDAVSTVTVRFRGDPSTLERLREHRLVRSLRFRSPNLVIETGEPEEVLFELRRQSSGPLEDAGIRRPTLEDVFIRLTGRALRET